MGVHFLMRLFTFERGQSVPVAARRGFNTVIDTAFLAGDGGRRDGRKQRLSLISITLAVVRVY